MTTLTERIAAIKKECEEIIALSEKATKGPWEYRPDRRIAIARKNLHQDIVLCGDEFELSDLDATFIARSRNITPALARIVLQLIEYVEYDTTCHGENCDCRQHDSAKLELTVLAEEFEKGKL